MSHLDKYSVRLDEYLKMINENNTSFIKDRSALDINHVPEELLFREKEFNEITRKTKMLFQGDTIPHIVLWGIPGTGKTVLMKYILKLMSDASNRTNNKVGVGYVNCVGASNYSIITTIMEIVGVEFSGQKENINIQRRRLIQKLETDQIMQFFVFDDFDKMSRGAEKDVLFDLTRLPYFNFCLIANNTNFVRELESYTKSSFNPRFIFLEKYTKEQLKGIIQQRIDEALTKNIFTPNAIEAIAQLSSLSGDARYAISLLAACVDIAEEEKREKIDDKIVARAKKMVEMNAAKEIIGKMAHNYLVELYAVLLKQNNGSIPTTTEVYETYTMIEKKYGFDSIISRRQFIRDLQDLTTTGIIHRIDGYVHRWKLSDFYDRDELLLCIESTLPRK